MKKCEQPGSRLSRLQYRGRLLLSSPGPLYSLGGTPLTSPGPPVSPPGSLGGAHKQHLHPPESMRKKYVKNIMITFLKIKISDLI